MKILFVVGSNRIGSATGGCVRTRLLYQSLQTMGSVSISVLKKEGADIDVSSVGTFGSSVRIVTEQDLRPKMIICRSLQMFSSTIVGLGNWAYPDAADILSHLGYPHEKFDLVVSRMCWPVQSYGLWKIAPLVVDVDDLPTEQCLSIRSRGKSWPRRATNYLFCRLWQNYVFRHSAATFLPNPFQIGTVSRYVRCTHLPNVVQMPERQLRKESSLNTLITIGALDYVANVHGIDWFLQSIWPKVRERYPDMVYRIIGRGLDSKMAERWLKMPGVELAGFVEDLNQVYQDSFAVVAPIFLGSGTAVKVVEALAYGKKIFATPFAVRGLSDEQIKDAHISVFAGEDDFITEVEAYCRLNDDEKFTLKTGCENLVRRDFSVERFNQTVRNEILRCMDKESKPTNGVL